MLILDASKSILVPKQNSSHYGVTEKTIPGSKIAMHVLTLLPGESVSPGNDIEMETAGYIVSGRVEVNTTGGRRDRKEATQGDFYFTPSKLAYELYNNSDSSAKIVVAYSLDPSVLNDSSKSKHNASSEVIIIEQPQDVGMTAQTRGMRRIPAVSADTVGASQIWMCFLTVNPNERGQPHHHGDTHTAAYTISGRARICFGENFDEFIEPGPGDIAFDPPGLIHLVDHPFKDEAWKGVLARCPQNTVVNFGN